MAFRTRRRYRRGATINVLRGSRRSVVVTAFPLKGPGRAKLAEQQGDVELHLAGQRPTGRAVTARLQELRAR